MTTAGQGHDGPTLVHLVADMNDMPRPVHYFADKSEAQRAANGAPVYCYRIGEWAIYAVEVGE